MGSKTRSEQQKKARREREKSQRDNLEDGYLRKLLNRGWTGPHPNYPEDFLSSYRSLIALKRVIREKVTGKKAILPEGFLERNSQRVRDGATQTAKKKGVSNVKRKKAK